MNEEFPHPEYMFAITDPYREIRKQIEKMDKVVWDVNQKPFYAKAPNKGNRKNQRKKR